ncbi:hypothetical protein F383_13953 [Gossypium arboreum]|uniref:Uncharacterized protein n=1 Tax=Gossypium arboreum TaxID=29729 RepID=A0A0B0Q300_GOSAR|nr:hypothetical protein F383_13953 [Gossypium arboreum]
MACIGTWSFFFMCHID